MNAWDKRKERERDRKLDCILKNQIVIMEGLAKALYTYEHTSRYGGDYIKPLEERAEITVKKYGRGEEEYSHDRKIDRGWVPRLLR